MPLMSDVADSKVLLYQWLKTDILTEFTAWPHRGQGLRLQRLVPSGALGGPLILLLPQLLLHAGGVGCLRGQAGRPIKAVSRGGS